MVRFAGPVLHMRFAQCEGASAAAERTWCSSAARGPGGVQELFQLCNGHKNIVELIEFRDFGTEFYFVMEFCPSTLLSSVLEENKVIDRLSD